MKLTSSILMTAVLLLAALAPQTARAQIDDVLGDIQWGDERATVIEKLRAAELNELREDPQLRNDRVAMQRARQRILDGMRAVEDSYTELRGQRTGFEVSVVADEFRVDNGESLIRVRDAVAQRYFFFVDARLYKLVVAYDQDYIANVGFEAFINHVSQRYGRPSSTDYGRVLGDQALVQAAWEDGVSQLRVNDRREFFGTYTMTFTDLGTLSRLHAENRVAGADGDEEEQVSSRVQALMQYSATDPNADIVDSLVGKVEVDLSTGEEEAEEEAAAQRAARAAEQAEKEEEERAEAQRARSRRGRSSSAASSSSTSSSSSSSSDDDALLIY